MCVNTFPACCTSNAQQLILLGRELDVLGADLDDGSHPVARKVADAKDRTLGVHLQLVAQRRAEPSQRLFHAERLWTDQ